MNKLRAFDIEIVHIKEHVLHTYDFKLDAPSFFTLFEDSIIQKGLLDVIVELEKTPLHIKMNISIKGNVELICDRSLDPFDYSIDSVNPLIFQFSEEEEGEITDEIIGIKRETIKINIAQYVYEFINLEVPIKKLHPRFQDDNQDDSDSILIYSTETEEEEKNDSPTEDLIDPRWLALKSLKDKSKLN
jgi:Predicted metal-binding, possibly nucleic acid-binding protein